MFMSGALYFALRLKQRVDEGKKGVIVSAVFIVWLFRKFNRLKDGDDSSPLGSAVK